MVKFAENIGSDVIVSGDFGELLLARYLVKKKLHVILAKTAGFDLLVKDNKGKIFKKDCNKLIGISVKARQGDSFSLNVKKDLRLLKTAAKIWKAIPYFCFIGNNEGLVFHYGLAKNKKYLTKSGRLSFPKLRSNKKFIRFNWNIS